VTGYTLDTGALLAVERESVAVVQLLAQAQAYDLDIRVPAAALAQALRDPPRQARLSRLVKLPEVRVMPLDAATARATGMLCAATGTSDVVDASVAVCAHVHGDKVITSDPVDLARLVGRDRVIAI
jgi:predicted nucleic acid-binding protein